MNFYKELPCRPAIFLCLFIFVSIHARSTTRRIAICGWFAANNQGKNAKAKKTPKWTEEKKRKRLSKFLVYSINTTVIFRSYTRNSAVVFFVVRDTSCALCWTRNWSHTIELITLGSLSASYTTRSFFYVEIDFQIFQLLFAIINFIWNRAASSSKPTWNESVK